MEILPIDDIKEDLEAMALVRVQLFEEQRILDRMLTELDISMLRGMGTTGLEYELSQKAAEAVSMLAAAQEKIRRDGMIGQLELKAGLAETLDEEQYHEKPVRHDDTESTPGGGENEQRQKEISILFISNQMGARMRQISLAEEDFYYFVRDMMKLWGKQIKKQPEQSDNPADPAENLQEFSSHVEKASELTEVYLKGYLKVTNTIKNVVMKNRIFIMIRPGT